MENKNAVEHDAEFSGIKWAGHYEICGPYGLQIRLEKRPGILKRLFNRAFLGYVWVDYGR